MYDGTGVGALDGAYTNDWHQFDDASLLLWVSGGNPSHRAADFFGGYKTSFGYIPLRSSGSAIPSNATISSVIMTARMGADAGNTGTFKFMLDGVAASPSQSQSAGATVSWDATASGSWTSATVLTRSIGILSDQNGGVEIAGWYHPVALTVTWAVPTPWSLTLPTMTLYTMSIAQPSTYTLPFDIFSGGVLYPAGTTFTWSAAADPGDTGWWVTSDAFAGAVYLVPSTTRPAAPRGFVEVTAFATGATKWAGGFPGVSTTFNNHLVYAAGGYVVGTTSPSVRIYDGLTDRSIASLPNTSGGSVPRAVTTMITANGVVYLATFDSGTSSADWVGRIFSLNIENGQLTPIGNPLTTGHFPYALCWHAGRLWCGTHRQNTAVSGKVFYIRPGIDTDWTADYDLATSSVSSVTSLVSFQGKLYVGTNNAAASFAKVLVRDTAGTYTTSLTLSGGAATAGNGVPALVEFSGALYASFYNADTPVISSIRKFDGSSWSTAYTASGSTLVPFIAFPTDGAVLVAIGGGVGISAVVIKTPDGSSWTNQSVFLSQPATASTGLAAFGVVVH